MGEGAAARRLAGGELEVLGRLPYSSNTTLLARVGPTGEGEVLAVYKPGRGERPLWDFPGGLFRRERAAFVLSEALGWSLVPATVIRDGPLGEGSVQRFVEADVEQHYFTLVTEPGHQDQLRRLCLFDLVANSTDRKGGHVLLGVDGRLWAIDNGLSFHADLKLRTVIWDFAGQPMPPEGLADLERLSTQGLPDELETLLDPEEHEALAGRVRAVLRMGIFPHDPTGRRWPWPVL